MPFLKLRGPLLAALAALPWLNPFSPGPSPQVVPWLVSVACVLALWFLSARGGLPRPRLPWPLLAFGLLAWLATGAARPELVFLAAGLGLVAIAAGFAHRPGFPGALQAGLLAAAAASAAIGLAQYFGLAQGLAPWVNAADAGSAFANLRQPNQFATLCWVGVAVLVFGTLPLPRAAAVGLAVLLGVGCAASGSRTGMLLAALVVLLAAVWSDRDRRERLSVVAAALLAYVAAASLLPMAFEMFTGLVPERRLWARLGGPEGCASRRLLWSNVLHLVSLQPWTGWGWGELDTAHYLTLYAGPRFCDILDNAHNLPLHLAVELGVPVAVVVTLGVLGWAWRQRPWRETEPLRQLAWALLGLLVLHSLLEYPLWYGPFQLALGICLGWLARTPPQSASRLTASLRGAVAGVLVAATGYAAWDYARVTQIYVPPGQRLAPWREDAMEHARRSWLFSGPARFADVTLAETTRANAQWMDREASLALHYSPEPRVIERVIESAVMLGRDDEALLHLARYRAAFPKEYAAWQRRQRQPSAP